MKFDLMSMLLEPCFAVFGKPVVRGVVDDQEDFAWGKARDKPLEKAPKCLAVEYIGKLISKARFIECNGSE